MTQITQDNIAQIEKAYTMPAKDRAETILRNISSAINNIERQPTGTAADMLGPVAITTPMLFLYALSMMEADELGAMNDVDPVTLVIAMMTFNSAAFNVTPAQSEQVITNTLDKAETLNPISVIMPAIMHALTMTTITPPYLEKIKKIHDKYSILQSETDAS